MGLISTLLISYLAVAGLMLGSFINLAADRLPRGESIVTPRSHCRACGRQLNAVDLLPVIGYLLRGGRCATCKASIGVSSPAIEAMCGASVLGAIGVLGLWPGAAIGLGLVALLGLLCTGFAFQRRRL